MPLICSSLLALPVIATCNGTPPPPPPLLLLSATMIVKKKLLEKEQISFPPHLVSLLFFCFRGARRGGPFWVHVGRSTVVPV